MAEQPVSKKKVGLSMEPELLGTNARGEMEVRDANHYVMLTSASQGTIFYIPRENQYYASEGTSPCPEKIFKEKFLPYLRWDYDQFEDEVIEVKNPDGTARPLKLNPRSSFPPTPENIAEKRKELIQAALDAGETPDIKQIYAKTSPRELDVNEKFKAQLDNRSADERLAARINRTLM